MLRIVLAISALTVLPLHTLAADRPQPKTYTLTLSENDIAVIGAALGDQPYKLAAPTVDSLRRQIAAQNKPDEPAPAEKSGDAPVR